MNIYMNRFSLLILGIIAVLAAMCAPEISFSDELSGFLQTRSDAPLTETVWEYVTGEEYNQYVTFTEDTVKLFYGKIEEGDLERWSPFYEAHYIFINGAAVTDLSYPCYGKKENTQRINVIHAGEAFEIYIDDKPFTYYGKYTESLDWQWIIITGHPPQIWEE